MSCGLDSLSSLVISIMMEFKPFPCNTVTFQHISTSMLPSGNVAMEKWLMNMCCLHTHTHIYKYVYAYLYDNLLIEDGDDGGFP